MTDSIKGPRLTRRSALAGVLGAAAAAAVTRPAAAQTPGRKPNILYIMADDLGYADLSCYGRREYETPVLDRLAAQGMMFMHAYANSAVCTATRVALITGRYQYRLPVGLQEPLGAQDVGLPGADEHPTIASLMRDAGYRTTLIGKWHMGGLPKYGPLKSGYDEFWGLRGGGVDYYRHGFNGNVDLWDGDTKVEETGYMTDLLADRTIATLNRRAADKRPFFVSLHFTAPHWPWEGPEDEAESNRLRALPGPDSLPSHDAGSLETFGRMVVALDAEIGRVLETLDELSIADDTIVIFTSDNGGERYSDTWPFTGKKTELLEGGLRVPAIVRWPNGIRAGVTSDQVMISMDWLPTLLATGRATHRDAPVPDGIDLLPWLVADRAPVSRTLFWRYHNMDQRACRSGDLKYLKILENEFLFDVVADPLERANLKERRPDEFARLKKAFDDWNATMLQIGPDDFTAGGDTGAELADHFGIRQRITMPEKSTD